MSPTNYCSSDDEDVKVTPAKGKATLRKKRRNKPKDYPKRPLSAYNVFFKETREEILASKDQNGEKRDHKLDFQTMAKEIAARWKALEKKERERVEKLAKKDMLRYRDEVKSYEEEMVKKNREQREEAAAKTAVKKEEEAAAAATNAAVDKARFVERRDKEEAMRSNAAANAMAGGGGASSSLETLSALAGRFQPAASAGSNEASLQEALFFHQQREMIQRQLLLEELRAVEEREMQLRRLQSLGLLQDPGFGGLQAHQLGGLLGGGGQNHAANFLLQDHSGRNGAGGLQGFLGGGHPLLGGAGAGLPHELLFGASGAGGALHQDAYLLQQQQQGLLQEHYARLFGHGKEAGAP